MLPRTILTLCTLVAVWGAESAAGAQLPGATQAREDDPSNCELIKNNFVYIRVLGDGTSNSYVSGPLEARCDDGVRILADSAVIFEASGYSQLFENVMFEDAIKQLTADRATYFGRDRRLIALGNGRIVDKVKNSVITGDTVVYARANSFRPQDLLNVRGGNPHATLFPPQREPDPPPDTAAADTTEGRVETVGERRPTGLPDTTAVDGTTEAQTDAVAPVRETVAASAPRRRGQLTTPKGVVEEAEATELDAAREAPDTLSMDPVDSDSTSVVTDSLATLVTDGPAAPDFGSSGAGGSAPRRTPSRTAPRYEIDALTFSITGDRYFRANGGVVIQKDSLEAFGDSLLYDQQVGDIVLMGSARIDEDAFELTGDTILFGDDAGESQEIRAVGNAALVGQDLDLTAPEIRIELRQGLLERLIAVVAASAPEPEITPPPVTVASGEAASLALPPPARPRAIAQDFVLVGDSIEVRAPGEVLEQVLAMGNARGESVSRDSLNAEDTPDVARRDWLEGDEVTVFFSPDLDLSGAPVLMSDGSGRARVELDRLVAKGSARSLYRMTPTDSTAEVIPGRLALHYVTGSQITIHLSDGEVESMEVVGQARGYHLEPLIEPGLIPSVSSDSASADSPVAEGEVQTDSASAGSPVMDGAAQTDSATAEASPSPDAPPDTATAPVAFRDAAIPGPEALRRTGWIASPWLRDEETVSLLKADLA